MAHEAQTDERRLTQKLQKNCTPRNFVGSGARGARGLLTPPVEMHTTLSAKNAYALVHARICNGAEASLPWKLLQTYLESCASIVQAVVCRSLLLPVLLSRPNPSPDAVRSRNPR